MDTNTDPVMATETVVTPAEIVTTTPTTSKKGKGVFGIIVLFLVFIIIAVIGIGGVFAYTTVKNSYMPVLSPVLEDLVLAPHEQLAQRFDVYYDFTKNILSDDAKAASNINALVSKELADNLTSAETVTEFSATVTLDKALTEGVLGVDDAGELDDETMAEILAAKEFIISGQTKATVAGLKDDMVRTMSENVITLKAAGNKLETKFDLYTELNDETSSIYLYLHYFPINDYYVTESIENMWLKYSVANNQQLLEGVNPPTTNEPTAVDNEAELLDSLEKIQKLIHHPVMAKMITAAPSQSVNGTSTKCYALTINNENYDAFEAAVKEVYPELVTKESEMPTEPYEVVTTFCFDSMLIARRVEVTMVTSQDGTAIDFTGSIQLNSFNQDYQIATPTNATDLEKVDWTKVVPMMNYYNDLSSPGYDYEGSESDLLDLDSDWEDWDLDEDSLFDDSSESDLLNQDYN